MTALPRLLRTFILRPLRRDLLRTSLTILSVALGVAVVVAIDLAGDAAAGSFRSSLETLLGKTDLQITANGGVDESWIGRLAQLPRNLTHLARDRNPGIARSRGLGARSTEWTCCRKRTAARREDGIAISRPLANRLGLRERLATAAAAQRRPRRVSNRRHRGREGRRVRRSWTSPTRRKPRARTASWTASTFRSLPARISPRRSRNPRDAPAVLRARKARRAQRRKSAHAARLPLESARAQLHLAGGRRLSHLQHDLGERGAAAAGDRHPARLGRKPRGVLWLFLGEALLLGFAGSVLGILLGRMLAGGAVGLIADTVNALYTSSRPGGDRADSRRDADRNCRRRVSSRCSRRSRRRAKRCGWRRLEAMGRGAHEHSRAAALGARSGLVSGGLALRGVRRFSGRPVDGAPVWGYVAALLAIGAAGIGRAGLRARRDTRARAQHAAAPLGRRRTARRPRTGRVALAHLGRGRGAGHRHRHDGERRHHGRQLPRDRTGLAGYATPRRSLRAPRRPLGRRPVPRALARAAEAGRPPPRRGGRRCLPRHGVPLPGPARHARRRRRRDRAPPRPAALPARRGSRRHPALAARLRTTSSSASRSPTSTACMPAIASRCRSAAAPYRFTVAGIYYDYSSSSARSSSTAPRC